MNHVIGHPNVTQVVFVGSFGVGKTTAVRTISDVRVLSTEAFSSPLHHAGALSDKTTTTVGLEYGEWTTSRGQRVAVIGTPGQNRFTAMRRTALAAGAAVVLWLYGNREDSPAELEQWLDLLEEEIEWSQLTVAVTRLDLSTLPLTAYRPLLDARHPGITLLAADPRDRRQVGRVVEQAIALTSLTGG